MLFSRPALSSMRGRQPTARICAGCFFSQRALLSTAAARGQLAQQVPESAQSDGQQQQPDPDTQDTQDAQDAQQKPRRKHRRRRLLQPGPPEPPWPKPHTAQSTGRRPYVSPRTLAENVVMINGMRGVLHQRAASLASSRAVFAKAEGIDTASLLSLGVPRLPDPETDYTEVGPGVVAPWQPGGAAFRPPPIDAKATSAFGGPKRMGVKLRLCDTHVLHPFSVKFLGGSDDIAPTGSGSSSSGFHLHSQSADGSAQTAFPHCLSEVVRRWYANKNRTDPLWWYVALISNENAGGAGLATIKNVVRSKTHAKVQHAFKTALARRGYSPAGVRLSGSDGSDGGDGGDGSDGLAVAGHPHLFGSVRIDAVLQRVLETEYQDLVGYMTGLLEGVEAELGGKGRVVNGVVTYAGPALGRPRTPKRPPHRHRA